MPPTILSQYQSKAYDNFKEKEERPGDTTGQASMQLEPRPIQSVYGLRNYASYLELISETIPTGEGE